MLVDQARLALFTMRLILTLSEALVNQERLNLHKQPLYYQDSLSPKHYVSLLLDLSNSTSVLLGRPVQHFVRRGRVARDGNQMSIN